MLEGNNLKNRRNVSITNAKKARKRGLKKVFSPLTLQTYQTYIQEDFKVFEWLSMTSLASFLKTKTLVMENYCPYNHILSSRLFSVKVGMVNICSRCWPQLLTSFTLQGLKVEGISSISFWTPDPASEQWSASYDHMIYVPSPFIKTVW